MFVVEVACSGCPGEDEVVFAELAELDGLGCECGYGCVALTVSAVELIGLD